MPPASSTFASAFEVHPDDLHAAAAAVGRAAARTNDTPDRLVAGIHDTHSASLDQALDEFREGAAREMRLLTDRAALLSAMLAVASARFSAVEEALILALSP